MYQYFNKFILDCKAKQMGLNFVQVALDKIFVLTIFDDYAININNV